MDKVNIVEKFKLFNEHWSPRIIGELNGQYIKNSKVSLYGIAIQPTLE